MLDYVLGLLRGDESKYAGHNAAGGWAIIALLTLGLLTGVSGWLVYQDSFANMGGEWLEEAHEALASGMLTVSDSGPGIPPAQRADALRRLHRLAGQDIEGSGLDLSIVARIAELHGARLALADGIGQPGLTVRVTFPH